MPKMEEKYREVVARKSWEALELKKAQIKARIDQDNIQSVVCFSLTKSKDGHEFEVSGFLPSDLDEVCTFAEHVIGGMLDLSLDTIVNMMVQKARQAVNGVPEDEIPDELVDIMAREKMGDSSGIEEMQERLKSAVAKSIVLKVYTNAGSSFFAPNHNGGDDGERTCDDPDCSNNGTKKDDKDESDTKYPDWKDR